MSKDVLKDDVADFIRTRALVEDMLSMGTRSR